MLASFISGCSANPPAFLDTVPVSYEYSYNNCMAHPVKWYQVIRSKAGDLELKTSEHNDEILVYNAPEECLEKIGGLAKEHKLWKLKSSYTPPMLVLDGYSWHLGISYKDDSIWSGGNNAWPDSKLWEGVSSINQYLQGLIDEAGEEGIVRRESHWDNR